MINSKLLEGQDFDGLSKDDAKNKREEKVKSLIDLALNWLDIAFPKQLRYTQTFSTKVSSFENVPHQVRNRYKTTVLVIYIDGFSEEVKNLATRVDYYYVAANTSITLIGIVADSAYVARGQHNL